MGLAPTNGVAGEIMLGGGGVKDVADEGAVKKKSFAERLKLDFVSVSNIAGNLNRGEVSLSLKPATLSLSLGGLKLNYLPGQLFFVSPKLELDATFRKRVNLFGRVATAIAFSNDSLQSSEPSLTSTVELGAVVSVTPSRSPVELRLGFDLRATGENLGSATFRQGAVDLGVGASLHYSRLTVYGTSRFFFAPVHPYDQYWTDTTLHYLESRAGAIVSLPSADITSEFIHSTFERGGRFLVSLPDTPFAPSLYLGFKDVSPPIGPRQEVTVGVSLSLDRPHLPSVRARVEKSFGGEDFRPAEKSNYYYSLGWLGFWVSYSISAYSDPENSHFADSVRKTIWNILAGYKDIIAGLGLTADDRFENITDDQIRGLFEKFGYWLMGELHVDRIPYHFRDTVYYFTKANTFDEFVALSKQTPQSTEEAVDRARQLAGLGLLLYDVKLRDAPVFSGDKKELAKLTPENVYVAIRQAFETGEKISAGVCANINGLAAEYLRQVGVEAYAVGIASWGGPHIITVARDSSTNTNYVVNYGHKYKAKGKTIWPVIQAYAQDHGIPILGIYLYGKNNELIGYYKGPEGELMEEMTGTRQDMLKGALIRKRE